MNRSIALGLGVVAGAALFEVALVPGIVIGGVAVLAPGAVRRARRALFGAKAARLSLAAAVPEKLRLQQSVVKTITFRVAAWTGASDSRGARVRTRRSP